MSFIVLLGVYSLICVCDVNGLRKEAYQTVPQLITSAGYPVEKHRTVTQDGYILQLHRIPAGKRTPRRSGTGKGKKAVLIVHGLLGHSGDFVFMGPEKSLAFVVADAGYDVWLANLRGNLYTTHRNLTRSNPEFWDYSFHEHGKYDLPAIIDKVLEVTGLSKILYVGYSMGTTSFFVMMSERPEYNKKIIAFLAMAPAVYLDHLKGTCEVLLKNLNIVETVRSQGMISFNWDPPLLEYLIRNFCNAKEPRYDICMQFVYMVVGEDHEQYDAEMTPVGMARAQPASWKQLEHFAKIALSGVFTSWEDGLYGCIKPYKLSNVKVPVSILYGENDQLTKKSQVFHLAKELQSNGTLEDLKPVSYWPKINHLDFVMAKDIGKLISEPTVKEIDNLYNKYGNL